MAFIYMTLYLYILCTQRLFSSGPVETGDLELTWNFASEGEQHRGSIPLKWLKENCYSREALRRRREAATPTLAVSNSMVIV